MEIAKKYLGIIALVIGIIGAIVCFSSNFGIVLLIIGVAAAGVDIFMGMKESKLPFQDYIKLAPKEKPFSVIAIVAIVIFAFFLPEIIGMRTADEAIDALSSAFD